MLRKTLPTSRSCLDLNFAHVCEKALREIHIYNNINGLSNFEYCVHAVSQLHITILNDVLQTSWKVFDPTRTFEGHWETLYP